MTRGCLVAVVGPSGVGKDTVIQGIAAAAPSLSIVRRTITRQASSGGEEHDAISQAAFERSAACGAFCLHWQAHGLRYGIPGRVAGDVQRGRICVANLSRSVLETAATVFPAIFVLHVTASPEVLAARLAARGRESETEINSRLARSTLPLADSLPIANISNDRTPKEAIAAALSALRESGLIP
ncbi:phosphonate metabolism protein/1,5-bisphosphokinase (PRPP-forming) PhnN [uncultured Roseobacter sp.]|uniref:phosphonate metabolism protein/1,5-bisphosphokinase (PRPP-forming) PhnN n=1 Tax=uncultured Roseobacter sp. TaxID=114847 RepID=UPI00261A337A|nr:phosphonate metabolism protein/1,5-bisphosphokinase (PRPP-forming) PhnN [uncultured Roseobacter sp.]